MIKWFKWSVGLKSLTRTQKFPSIAIGNKCCTITNYNYYYSQCRHIYKTLYSLCQIQEMAYEVDHKRTETKVLRFQLKVLEFATGYGMIFGKPKNPAASLRKIFGGPYHSVIAHMPLMYRYISLLTVAVEAEERQFHDLRWVNNKSRHWLHK